MTHSEFIPPSRMDVLKSEPERIRRMASLYKAAAMYSHKGSKVTLKIMEEGTMKELDIAVMAAGSQTVMCSGGMNIPVNRILEVGF